MGNILFTIYLQKVHKKFTKFTLCSNSAPDGNGNRENNPPGADIKKTSQMCHIIFTITVIYEQNEKGEILTSHPSPLQFSHLSKIKADTAHRTKQIIARIPLFIMVFTPKDISKANQKA